MRVDRSIGMGGAVITYLTPGDVQSRLGCVQQLQVCADGKRLHGSGGNDWIDGTGME